MNDIHRPLGAAKIKGLRGKMTLLEKQSQMTKEPIAHCMAFSAMLLLLLAGCATVEFEGGLEEPGLAGGRLRVGYSKRAPFVTSEERVLGGTDIELLRLFGKDAGLELDFKGFPLNELVFALRRGEVDIVAAGFTGRELERLFLSGCGGYMETGKRIVLSKELAPFITDMSQLNNSKVTIYTVVGTPASEDARMLFPEALSVSLRDIGSCLERMKGVAGGVLLLNAREAWPLFSGGASDLTLIPGVFSEDDICWGVRRRDTGLKRACDEFIRGLRAQGRLREIIETNRADIINR